MECMFVVAHSSSNLKKYQDFSPWAQIWFRWEDKGDSLSQTYYNIRNVFFLKFILKVSAFWLTSDMANKCMIWPVSFIDCIPVVLDIDVRIHTLLNMW